jgi:hypothetical protein
MTTKALIDQLASLEKEGITASIGDGVLLLKDGKYVVLRWSNVSQWASGKPSGSFSEQAAFADYADLPRVFAETLEKLRTRINSFLAGGGI